MVWLLLVFLSSTSLLAAPTPHTVQVPKADIDEYLKKHENVGRAEATERLLLFRLAVNEARQRGWDREPETAREIDRALYASYLRHVKSQAGDKLEPADSEVREAYQQEPLVRLRILTLRNKNTVKLEKIRKEHASGTPFQSLVLKYSEDEMRQLGGDMDFRGPQNLPAAIYAAARKLKKNEVSGVIQTTDAIHLVQLIDTRSFADAGATYVGWLRGRLRTEREQRVLSAALGELKKSAAVEITP